MSVLADRSRATVTVPLVDDSTAETTERFTIRLSQPSGATLTDTWAAATITDDDPVTTTTPAAVAVCDGAAVRGSIAGVFHIAQTGFDQSTDVFVDVDVSCGGDLATAVGYPTAVQVVSGPAAGLGSSRWCVTASGARLSTASVPTAAGCRTYPSPGAAEFTRDGRSTHIVRIPDSSLGTAHQVQVWVDADADGDLDGDEPRALVNTDFAGRTQSDGGTSYGLPEDFQVSVQAGSDRFGRGGQWTGLRLRFEQTLLRSRPGAEPVEVTVPLDNLEVHADIAVGPSRDVSVSCLSLAASGGASPGAGSGCVTNGEGELLVRYLVPSSATSRTHAGLDVLRVWADRDGDGVWDLGPGSSEPSDTVEVPVAKAVNYVALGDSYSAGEAGDSPPVGAYQSGISAADDVCKRWDHAYPYNFNRFWLRNPEPTGASDDPFRTYACVGAVTLNVYDPRTLGVDNFLHSNRASPAVTEESHSDGEFAYPDGWESRQAASLRDARLALRAAMQDLDMITITIGGNDAGFAKVLEACVLGGFDCDRGDLSDEYDDIPARLSALMAELREAAPRASIFVLGYPYITPPPVDRNRSFIEQCGEPGQPLYAAGVRANAISALYHFLRLGTESDAAISFSEAEFLWSVATDLNQSLRNAASAAGVHFVDVSGGQPSLHPSTGFTGHSPCSDEPWINGFVPRPQHLPPVADNSFHPNDAGHRAYARLLASYIWSLNANGAALSDAGLPINPGRTE